MLVLDDYFLAFASTQLFPHADFIVVGRRGAFRSIRIVLETSVSSTVIECCYSLFMWNGPSAFAIILLSVELCVLFELFVFTASAGPSTKVNLLVLKTVVLRARLS